MRRGERKAGTVSGCSPHTSETAMRLSALVAIIAALCGCAERTHVLPPIPSPSLERHFNSSALGASVGAETTGGDQLTLAAPVMTDRSLTWYDSAAQRTVHRPVSDFRELRLKNHNHGAVDGLLTGVGFGLVTGFLLSKNFGDCQPHCARLQFFTATVIPGAFVGLVVGSAVGAPETYRVASDTGGAR